MGEPVAVWSKGHHSLEPFVTHAAFEMDNGEIELLPPMHVYWRWVPAPWGYGQLQVDALGPERGAFPVTVAWVAGMQP